MNHTFKIRQMIKNIVICFALVSFMCSAKAIRDEPSSDTDLGAVDFRYTPPMWQTSICLPDDPDKSLVGREGQVLLDYNYTYATSPKNTFPQKFNHWLQADIVNGTRWVKQETVSPRVPIVRTYKDAGGIEMLEETFVVIPKTDTEKDFQRLVRTDTGDRLYGWSNSASSYSPALTGVDAAHNGKSVQYKLTVPAGRKVTVVFGLCEGVYISPGNRPLVLTVEGNKSKTVDPVKDFGGGKHGLYKLSAQDSNQDGIIPISVRTPDNAKDRMAVLNAIWVFDGVLPDDESILKGKTDTIAYAAYPISAKPERQIAIKIILKNTDSIAVTRQPILRFQTPMRVSSYKLSKDNVIVIDDATRVASSETIVSCSYSAVNHQYVAYLEAVTIQPGATYEYVFTIDRHTRKQVAALSIAQARQLREEAQQWWENFDLPYNIIELPDAGMQAMIESCIRNIWQAREIKNNLPAFHVGPTIFRSLWFVDGVFLLEAATLLNRGKDARAGIEYLLSYQKPDGSFETIKKFWKENGIVLWGATRHAFLTQDKEWLKSRWQLLKRVVKAIQNLRAQASKDTKTANYRLLPDGFGDGGLGKVQPEYTNVHWILVGLKAAIAGAHWIGDEESAAAWQKEYDDIYNVFRKACERDMQTDKFGNRYVPVVMQNPENYTPQKAQWTFCHAVYPGQIFPKEDPMVEGQLAMLRATKVQGFIPGTGWMDHCIWTYFSSFYAHANLWQGNAREAAQVLYDFARHACPTRVWREEQRPVGLGGDESGDMPHNWASAEFIRLATHLLQLDRGDELHLLEGYPREWAHPGMVTRLNGVLTPFGALHFEVRISEDGKNANIKLLQLKGRKPSKVVLHLEGLTGKKEVKELETDQDVELTIAK